MRRKPLKFQLFLAGLSISILLFTGLPGQDEVVERVEVVNREVVVRVFAGGEPLPGLTRKDFTLMENGKPAVITSCREVRRALAPMPGLEQSPEKSATARRSRLFLFLLWWNEESRDWPEAWDYFLKNIFHPGDRIILAGDQKAIQILSPKKEQQKLQSFFQGLNRNLKHKWLGKTRLTQELENCVREFHESLFYLGPSTSEAFLLNRFRGCYRGALDEYRLRRLRAQPEMLDKLATALRAVDNEKWALLFLQNERLPMVHKKSRLFTDAPMAPETKAALNHFIDDCDRRMRMATDMALQVRDLRSLFIGAGATFHLFLSDPRGEMLDSDFLRWFPVFSSWESAFRDIARDTGGQVQDTTKLQRALKKAATRPDISYVLTYKPHGRGIGHPKLKIRVSRPGTKVIYARKLQPREIRPLKMSEPQWNEGTLNFNLSDYLRETGEKGKTAGDMHVTVSTETPGGNPLKFTQVLRPETEAAAVEMKMNFPGPGDYILTVAVRDRLSGNSVHGHTQVCIAPPEPEEPMDPKLLILMDKAAAYCRRLRQAAFRFTCTEVVEERVLERNAVNRRVEPVERSWHYDYQVVTDQGSVQERRRLVRYGVRKVDVPDAGLETRFKALYPVFLPVTLLGEHNRENYRYKLVEAKRLKKRSCAVVEVTPRREDRGPLARGKVWVDVDDGSVLKIEMDPRGVRGSTALEAAAKKMSARLDLKVVHWYLEERKGLRFPSSAEFSESYVFDREVKGRGWVPIRTLRSNRALGPATNFRYRWVEFYRMTQEYKKYRHFEVDTRVRIGNPD